MRTQYLGCGRFQRTHETGEFLIVKLSLVVVNVDKPLVEGHTLRGGMNQMFENHVRVAIMYVTMKLDGPCWGKLEL